MEKIDIIKRYNLPEKVRFCKQCVISNQRPRITFNDDGVCSACSYAAQKHNIAWQKREEELLRLLDKHRKNNGEYDVLVPCSGGKDGSFVAWELKNTYGMNPLTVTWASHVPTALGEENFNSFVDAGFSNIKMTPDGEVHRRLTRLSFAEIGDPFQPFIYGQKVFPLQVSVKYNIPLVFYGENGEVEYGGDSKNAHSPVHNLDSDMTKHYFSGVGPEEWLHHGFSKKEIYPYLPPSLDVLHATGTECHFFGYYRKWDPKAQAELAMQRVGFKPRSTRTEGTYTNYASLDDAIDGMHYYLAFIKFGIGRCTSDAAHEVRDGRLSREQAVQLVHMYDGEFPAEHHKTFLEYTGLTYGQCTEIIDRWRSPHLWEQRQGFWYLKHKVS